MTFDDAARKYSAGRLSNLEFATCVLTSATSNSVDAMMNMLPEQVLSVIMENIHLIPRDAATTAIFDWLKQRRLLNESCLD